jgi:hypothetical protein
MSCTSSQLDANCECFDHTGGPALADRPPTGRVAIATVWDGGRSYACAIPLWCQQASALARQVPGSELLIMSPTPSVDCPHATHIFPVRTKLASQSYLQRLRGKKGGSSSGSGGSNAFAISNLLKVALFSLERQYELLLYADLDIDLMASRFDGGVWQRAASALLGSSALFVSLFDHASPVNGGLWLVRPRCKIFHGAMAVLERGTWSAKQGFDSVGSPQAFSRSIAEATPCYDMPCYAALSDAMLCRPSRALTVPRCTLAEHSIT